MRGTMVQGRYSIDYENGSINEGMVDELRSPVGTAVDWWVWDETYFEANPTNVVSSIYDTSNPTPGLGRMWKPAISMPAIMAQLTRGQNVFNERGLYVVDSLRVVLALGDVIRLLPDLLTSPDLHIKDRLVFQGDVFVPTRVNPRGRYADKYAVITLDCNMVNPEELVNDEQFLQYAS